MSDSYSQHGEDRIISAYLDRCQLESGMILDIGAWDPIDKSNSRLFIERGWTAILIDPSPMAVRNLAKAYEKNDRVIVISAAVAFEHELAKVRITDDAVSTTEQKQAETWKDEGGYYGTILVPTMTLVDIFTRYGGAFDIVSIDTEGTSVDLTIALLKAGPRPRVLCVEHDNRQVELMGAAQEVGYRMLHLNGTNAILVL